MATKATTGIGALIRYHNGTAWVSFGEITNVSGPTMSRDTHDVTSLASTAADRDWETLQYQSSLLLPC